ncbi:hypothetical protein BN77_2255 [Rhizobium mesoamericanum STM3625]|uniref:Uncharacterized protein n=1 Tax=Rhizobium mesoamericanum STM3625 TaxID=1211777 RepID=K0PEW6_9HYPH|nr:hypothetical protein BN77_2255 [Rhizobium mesoamericanum STM3625]
MNPTGRSRSPSRKSSSSLLLAERIAGERSPIARDGMNSLPKIVLLRTMTGTGRSDTRLIRNDTYRCLLAPQPTRGQGHGLVRRGSYLQSSRKPVRLPFRIAYERSLTRP